jgi:preprotein translocase subunit SecF
MEFFKANLNLDFMGKRTPFMAMSLLLVTLAIASFFVRQLNFGLDFTGGTLLEISYQQPVELDAVRGALTASGFGEATVQHFGTSRNILVRLAPKGETATAAVSKQAFQALQTVKAGTAELLRVEFVGPQVGKEIAEDGGLAVLYSLIGILVYVALRFEYRFALGAVIATIHDVVITVGVFSVFGIDFDLTVLAAVLAVIGYSLNDTIVVFDRIREMFRKQRKGTVSDIINQAINQTLSRTLMTSIATLITVVALYLFGGKIIEGFALALIVGIVVGTYSSIYIASAALLWLRLSRSDLVVPQKEGSALDKGP